MADTINTALAGVKASSNVAIKSITDAIFGTTENQQATQESFRKSEQQQDIITGAIRTVTATKELGEAATQKTMLDLSISASDDGQGIASTQARLIAQYKAIEDARAGKLQQINAKKAIRPEEDLFGWLGAQFTLDSDISEYNAAGDQANQAFSQLQGLNTLIDGSWQAQQRVKQTVTVASANAAADQAAAESVKIAQTLHRDALISNTNAVQQIATLNAQQLQVRHQAFNADVQMEQLSNARAHLKLATEASARDEQRLKEFLEEKEDKKAAVQDTFNMIRRGMLAAGATAEQMDQITPQYIRNVIAGRTPQDPKLQEYLRLGNKQLSSGLDTDNRLLGISPADALTTISTLNPKLSDDAKATYQRILVQARDEILNDRSPAVQTVLSGKDKTQIERIVNERANQLVATDARSNADPKSIYYLPPVKTISDIVPGVKGMKMWEVFLADAVASNVNLKDPVTVLALGQQAVIAKKLTVNELADNIATMYQSAQSLNLISKQVVNLGLDAPVSYLGVDLNGKPLDYTKTLDVKKAIMAGYKIGFGRIPGVN